MQLSPHFTLDELTRTEHRAWIRANREQGAIQMETLIFLASLLERVRALCGSRPLVIHSGFRCPGLNAAIGGSATSQHMLGQAADFHVVGLDLAETWRLIAESGLPFGQLILEGWAEGRPSWIHLSTVGQRSARRCGEVMTWDPARGYVVVRRVPVT
jgi:hypothetical protein